eukprot:COSAG06_NODE_2183_length_7395_cov_114.726425_4_plen_201_part_00
MRNDNLPRQARDKCKKTEHKGVLFSALACRALQISTTTHALGATNNPDLLFGFWFVLSVSWQTISFPISSGYCTTTLSKQGQFSAQEPTECQRRPQPTRRVRENRPTINLPRVFCPEPVLTNHRRCSPAFFARACLDKSSSFLAGVFLPKPTPAAFRYYVGSTCYKFGEKADKAYGAENAFFEPFKYKSHLFTKTGSGQT